MSLATFSESKTRETFSQTHPLMSHSGFEHVFCYGDVLLSFIWSHDDDLEVKRKMSTDTLTSDMEQITTSPTLKHDFIRTQFHRTTHCDFCSKKVRFSSSGATI
jgi:hypothetical protein